MLTVGILLILFLLLIRCPLFVALGSGATVLAVTYMNLPLLMIPQTVWGSVDSFVLMAIPFFLLAGSLMTSGGIAKRLYDFFDDMLGHLPGGMAIVMVLSCMFFAAISGSSPATAIAVGSIMLEPMIQYGYDRKFVMGLICASGTLGILIPPSIPMIMYGSITEQSVPKLFMAGMLPGLFLGFFIMGLAVFISWKRGYGRKQNAATWAQRGKSFIRAIPVLLLPVTILGGIYGGIFTPTEAGAVSCVLALLISAIYREMTPQKFLESLKSAIRTTGMIFLIICSAILLGKAFIYAMIPQEVTIFVNSLTQNKYVFLILVNMLYLVLGCIFETVTIIYVVVPILLPAVLAYGIDPIHFGIIVIVNTEIALITPPVGMNLYVVSGMAKRAVVEVVQGVYPFIILMLAGLMVITYWPKLSLLLVDMFF